MRIDRLLASPLFTRTLAAIEISEPTGHRILYARNADLLLRPASLMKLVTTAAVTCAFDDHAQFHTAVTATIDSFGQCDVSVRAAGDPFIDAQDITSITDMLRARGVRAVRSLMLDPVAFDSIPFGAGWMWDDEDADFTPHLDGFLYGNGQWNVSVTTSGSSTRVDITPAIGVARVEEDLRIGARTEITVRRRRDANVVRVSGTIRAGDSFHTQVSMALPRRVFHAALLASFTRSGIDVLPSTPLASRISHDVLDVGAVRHPIGDAVREANVKSDNRCAEALLRLVGARAGKGSAKVGIEAVAAVLDSAGVRTSDIVQADGSGLSPYNLTSAAALGSLLRVMAVSKEGGRFRSSLAQGAASGTLRNRFFGTAQAGRVRAKTGTMRGISGLAGYIERERGEPLAFVIMMQNFTGDASKYRKVQDAIVALLLDYTAATPGVTPTR